MKADPVHCVKNIYLDIIDPRQCYVISEDIVGLLTNWAGYNGFRIPHGKFFDILRYNLKTKLENIFPKARIAIVSEAFLRSEITSLSLRRGPFISLDKAYCSSDISLDVTRMVNVNLEPLQLGSRTNVSISTQYATLRKLFNNMTVGLIDDVIYGGDSMIGIIKRFNDAGIQISDIIVGVVIGDSGQKIIDACASQNPRLRILAITQYMKVIDEICERDFYAGVPLSGKLIGHIGEDGDPIPNFPEEGAPYFSPFGDAAHNATIPENRTRDWSIFCLNQSIFLWNQIELTSDRTVLCSNLARVPRGILPCEEPFVKQLCEHLRILR